MSLFHRFTRHLSFANVVACLALFVALGGGAYAASKINGSRIVKHSIAGNRLKNKTITSRQIKKGSINSSVIKLTTLGTVPSAQTAATATNATTATSAQSANTADRANSAGTADNATDAGHATSADVATNANHADTAGDAGTVGGRTAAQLTDTCPTATELFGGMCWEKTSRSPANWFEASKICGEAGGRLPSLSELVAYVLQEGVQATDQTWSSDVAELTGGVEQVLTSNDDEPNRKTEAKPSGTSLGYRCLFYRTNSG
ncbi:MAG TPA: hypothetical protein VHE08_08505 [Solirubrobacterales bacterium]|nr:hypothetical protein [Solirubrobacterales bacterium]